ncbi:MULTISPECIES: hypothetical protein [Cupriavidus]
MKIPSWHRPLIVAFILGAPFSVYASDPGNADRWVTLSMDPVKDAVVLTLLDKNTISRRAEGGDVWIKWTSLDISPSDMRELISKVKESDGNFKLDRPIKTTELAMFRERVDCKRKMSATLRIAAFGGETSMPKQAQLKSPPPESSEEKNLVSICKFLRTGHT